MDWTDRSGPGQADMDGPNGSAADGRKKKKKKSSVPERVTLKKEIGLLSACTIIIGEEQLPVAAAAQLSLQLCVASVGNNPKAQERNDQNDEKTEGEIFLFIFLKSYLLFNSPPLVTGRLGDSMFVCM